MKKNFGPLLVLGLLLAYCWWSPALPLAWHEYVRQIIK